MDTKGTLERACRQMEDKYLVPDDFKRRIREILQPLFRHDLSADEILVIEKALERTYVRHAHPVSGDSEGTAPPAPRSDSGRAAAPSDGALETELAAAGVAEAPAVEKPKKSGGVLLVRIDPRTKTASLVRMSAADVKKALRNKAAFAEFLKDSQDEDDTVVH